MPTNTTPPGNWPGGTPNFYGLPIMGIPSGPGYSLDGTPAPATSPQTPPVPPTPSMSTQALAPQAPTTSPPTTYPTVGTPFSTNISGYDPERISIDPKTDTVAGQIDTIIGKDSPLMQSARTRGKQTAQRRGLLNTSIAGQAGEQAVIQSALPIASQDAATYFRARGMNQQAANQAASQLSAGQTQGAFQERAGEQSRTLAEQANQFQNSLLQIKQEWAAEQAGLDRSLRTELTDKEIAARMGLSEQDFLQRSQLSAQAAGQQEQLSTVQGMIEQGLIEARSAEAQKLADTEGRYRQLLQANQSAARLFATHALALSEIMAQPGISSEAKQKLIDKQIQLLENGLAVIGGISNLDLTGLLDFD